MSDSTQWTTDGSNPLDVLAGFVARQAATPLSDEVRAAATRGVVDMVGVAVAGARHPSMRPVASYVAQAYGAGSATGYGAAAGLTPEAAAWLNGAAAHVLDFDDCLDIMGGHPTVPVLPAVLAVAEAEGLGAREALRAYAIGVQVETVLGRCLNFRHYEKGWHPTATLGVFGATAAAAHLFGLDAPTTATAFAVAASFASGLKGNFGSPMKPIQVGFAASKGITAARLAQLGVTANPAVFDGPQSFPMVFNGTDPEAVDWAPLKHIDDGWEIVSPGLTFKLYPCCGSTHAPIDAALELRERHSLAPSQIDRIDVFVHPRRRPHTDRPDPRTAAQGKFSVQYVVALALARGAVANADFVEGVVDDQAIRALMRRVVVHDLPPQEQTVVPGRSDCYAATVAITDVGGREHRLHAPAPKGFDPAYPVADADLRSKFIATAGEAIGARDAQECYDELLAWCGGDASLASLHGRLRDQLRW